MKTRSLIALALAILVVALPLSSQAQESKESFQTHIDSAQKAENAGAYDKAIESYTAAIAAKPDVAMLHHRRGVCYFMAGKMKESIADFDKFLVSAPEQAPHHWQRGLAYYYAGEYEKGRKQFEIHQDVNSNDVENAVWHFLCVAKIDGVEKARTHLIPITGDARVPMKEVQQLFAGKGTVDDVIAAAKADAPSEASLRNQLCYAHLYLGLYFEALGDEAKAAEHMKEAATTYRMKHYMGEVPRVHRLLRSESGDGSEEKKKE